MKKIRSILALTPVVMFMSTPQVLLAAIGGTSTDPNIGGTSTNPGGGGSGGLTNPLQSDSIVEFILNIIDILLVFAIPIIVLFIMYAGFKYVTAAGDEGKIREAHQALTWSVVGGVIILGAKLIIDVIQGTIGSL